MPSVITRLGAAALYLAGVAAVQAQGLELPGVGMTPAIMQVSPRGEVLLSVGREVTSATDETYTVMIPVTEERIINGQRQQRTRQIPEQRTRTVTRSRSVTEQKRLMPGEFLIVNTSGRQMPSTAPLAGRSMPVVMVEVDQLSPRLPPYFGEVLKRSTVVVVVRRGGVDPMSGPNGPAPPLPGDRFGQPGGGGQFNRPGGDYNGPGAPLAP